jgi:hypothetical protein
VIAAPQLHYRPACRLANGCTLPPTFSEFAQVWKRITQPRVPLLPAIEFRKGPVR